MMIKNITVLVVVFLLGMWIGSFNGTIVEVEVIKEVKVNVPYLDLTAPDLKHRLEVVANTLNLTLQDKKSINDLHKRDKQKLEDIRCKDKQALKDAKRKREQELKSIEDRNTRALQDAVYKMRLSEHAEYSRGYKEGYRDAMQKGKD